MYRGDAAVYENIAENLRYLRASRDPVYSQREIAKKLHVSKSTSLVFTSGGCFLWGIGRRIVV